MHFGAKCPKHDYESLAHSWTSLNAVITFVASMTIKPRMEHVGREQKGDRISEISSINVENNEVIATSERSAKPLCAGWIPARASKLSP